MLHPDTDRGESDEACDESTHPPVGRSCHTHGLDPPAAPKHRPKQERRSLRRTDPCCPLHQTSSRCHFDQDLLHIFSYLPRDLNFLEHTSNIGWKEFQRARPIIIDPGLYHSKKSGVFWAKEKRSLPSSFKLFMGSEWMVVTRSFLEFSIWGWDNLPRTLLLYYANVLSSTEGYFHTVICNNKDYQNTTVNHDLHYIRWDNHPKQQPMNLTLEHFNDMVQSGAPFARNFARDDPVLDKIDKELLRRSDARFTPGGWCVGDSRVLDKDPCLVHGSPHAVKPSLGSRRLEKLVLKLLHSDNFRTKQCK